MNGNAVVCNYVINAAKAIVFQNIELEKLL